MDGLQDILQGCIQEDSSAQESLYNRYSSLFLSMILRYVKRRDVAEDVLVEGFYKIFSKIDSFNGKGSFEGWMKRIMVNEALMELRKKNVLHLSVELNQASDRVDDVDHISRMSYEELLTLLDDLPPGYRTVFNMYVIEGYKHREIAEILDISINTSKSQLILAKKKMQELVKKKHDLTKLGS